MIKIFVAFAATLLNLSNVFAVSDDSLATITSAKNTYQFVYNQRENRVEIKQVLNTNYISNGYQVTIPVSEVYNNDQVINNVDCKIDNRRPSDFKPRDTYYSENDIFYSDARICYFPVTMPKKGSTANVIFNETYTDPRYFTSIFFTEPLKIERKEVVLRVPKWMKVELKELNFDKYQIQKTVEYDSKADEDVITYTAQNLPATRHEQNSPGPTYIHPHLLVMCKSAETAGHSFTYFNVLADQYAWYRDLVKKITTDKAVIDAKAKELTTGLTTDIDKIKAVFYYVQDNIRYIAFEDGLAGFKPESADEVLRKKYGDCKGMANLTKSLLVSLGFDARLCWLGTSHIAYDYQTPSMAVDNHMICALFYKGKTMYLDATESYLGLNEYAERIQGRQVLIEDGDKYMLSRVPVAPVSQNYDLESSKLNIAGSNLTGTVNHVWKGEDKEEMIFELNSIKKERSDNAMMKFLSNDNNNYVISGMKMSDITNIDKDFTASYNFDFKNAVSLFSKSYYVDLDMEKQFLNSTIKLNERKYDYWFHHKTNISKETELTIPANYKVSSLPPDLEIVNPDYEFHIHYVVSGNKLTYKKLLVIKNTRLPVSKFEQWNKDIEQLAKTYNETIILKPTTE